MLPIALGVSDMECKHGRGKGADASGVERRLTTDLQWFAVGQADGVHQCADGLGYDVRPLVVAVRPRLSEGGDGNVDQAGIDLC